MDFHADIRSHILTAMPCAPQDKAAVQAKNVGELLVAYLNWCSRFVVANPRRVHISRALASKRPLADARHEAALTSITADIERGADLTRHLSRGIKNGIEIPNPGKKRLNRRKDLDLMLNDWGVHHLHLSTTVEPDGFVTRTKPVIFATFHADDAYLLDIVDHGDAHPDAWTKRHILEIMAREWSEARLLVELRGVMPGTDILSDADRLQIRKAGGNTTVSIDGRLYITPSGMSTAGTTSRATMDANRILRHAANMQRDLQARSGPTWGQLLQTGFMPTDPERLRFVFLPQGYGLYDEISRALIKMA